MKRYWKIALLVPFIVLCIGTFYLDAAGNSYPEYYLKLEAGDEKEAAGITVHANYTDQSLTIRSEGSVYQREEPFLKSLTSNHYVSPEIAKLQKEHRQFMRGKSIQGSFYEDDHVLGYAEIASQNIPGKGQFDFRFIVATYDKKQKTHLSFKVAVPRVNDNQSIRISDVQIVGQTMSLITLNTKGIKAKAGYDSYTEAHIYKLDLDKKNITADQVILSGATSDLDDPIEIRSMPETEFTKPKRYSVFQITHLKREKQKDPSGAYTTDKKELVYYDLESGKLVPIQVESINDLLQKSSNLDVSYSPNELLLTYLKDPNAARFIRFSLAENKIKSDLTIDTKHSQAEGERLSFMNSAKNRWYMIGYFKYGTLADVPSFVVADRDTGRILYEGYISRKDNKALSNLIINNVLFQ
jgi:hypothetical protein